jgi:L-lysine exporter family protein LysE/ArgO
MIGALAGFAIGLGAVSADCFYFGVALMATDYADALQSPVGMRIGFSLGAAMLTWLGYLSLKSALKESAPAAEQIVGAREAAERHVAAPALQIPFIKTYGIGLALTLVNPMTIVFWLSIAVSFSSGAERTSPVIGFAGVFAGTLSWVTFVTLVVAYARRWVTPKMLRAINFISALILFGFAASFWWKVYTAGS